MRAQVSQVRDTAVRRQVSKGEGEVRILPAPILYMPTDAHDFPFHNPTAHSYMLHGFRLYYRLGNRPASYEEDQPLGYCIAGETWEYYHAEPCAAQGRKAAR